MHQLVFLLVPCDSEFDELMLLWENPISLHKKDDLQFLPNRFTFLEMHIQGCLVLCYQLNFWFYSTIWQLNKYRRRSQ